MSPPPSTVALPSPGSLSPGSLSTGSLSNTSDDTAFGRSAICDPTADSPFDAILERETEAAVISDVAVSGVRRADVGSDSKEPRRDGPRGFLTAGSRGTWADLDWPTVIWIGAVHLAALAAPFYFTWSGLAICLFLYWVTGGLGVCLGYHRLLTHGSFTTFPAVKFLFAWIGGISGEGSALVWVANHRKHHAFSDQEGDPHTPRDGGLWAHMLWIFPGRTAEVMSAHTSRWAPDLARDGSIRFLHQTFLLWHFLIGAALLGSGWALYGRDVGISWLIWGLAVRMVIVFHITWLVNSATHMWGYRNYETTDDSRNLWWVGLLAFGEGWHNNHHAFQRMACHGHKWWEVDTTYWVICALERLGLAWNVVHTPYGTGQQRGPR